MIYLFHKEYRKQAVAFILGGIGVSLIEVKLVSLMSPVGYQYIPRISPNPIQIISNFFNDPAKIENWKFSLIPFSLLPLFSPGAMLAVFLDFSQYFITGKELSRMWTPYQHHRAILAPFFTIGLIESLIFLKNKKLNINYVILFVLFVSILSQYLFHFPLNKLSKKEYWKFESWMNNNYQLFKTIPKNASLASSQNLVPHLSHRNKIYLLWPRQNGKLDCKKGCWWLEFAGKPQYLVVDLHPGQWVTQLLESNENFGNAIKNMEREKKIELIKKVGDGRLYKINY